MHVAERHAVEVEVVADLDLTPSLPMKTGETSSICMQGDLPNEERQHVGRFTAVEAEAGDVDAERAQDSQVGA